MSQEIHQKYAPTPDRATPLAELTDEEKIASGTQNTADDGAQPLEIEDPAILLTQPALLEQAITAAIKTQNIAGLRALLPVYQQYPERDMLVVELAQAILARADAQPGQLAHHLRNILQQRPDAETIRFQLATALQANRQYSEADEQWSRLQQASLPTPLQEEITVYRNAISAQSKWRGYAGFHFINDKNINNAPKQSQAGALVYNPRTRQYEYSGWVFDQPIQGRGVGYQFGGGKKWLWKEGFFATLDADVQGKYFFRYSQYNDLLLRVSPAVGRANWRSEWQVGPFVERRWFANRPYSLNVGISTRWKYNWTPQIQSIASVEYGRQTHDERGFLNNNNLNLGGTLLYQHSANQYWLGGVDYTRESGTRDADDSFRRSNFRLVWGQRWPQNIHTQLSVAQSKSRYDGPSLFSKGQNREDKERMVSLSIWKENWQWNGMTPRLLLSKQQVRSNDFFRQSEKNRVMLELKRDW
ncbi:surface lipoprotein assembly modifier [Suttonella sp. R2A3]|uniref:surface lipoprotein assembly modifier n=1 Tax=Suttonella sp. R2A3 TaxID=2908648 RepID=UPI001F2E06A8|nr:surface lipoprotein assembly modifier [Suttonella sp. R2A3]UJF23965.1 surface lipoprotein assembly modifier [Suttonella sp. R2A3]